MIERDSVDDADVAVMALIGPHAAGYDAGVNLEGERTLTVKIAGHVVRPENENIEGVLPGKEPQRAHGDVDFGFSLQVERRYSFLRGANRADELAVAILDLEHDTGLLEWLVGADANAQIV